MSLLDKCDWEKIRLELQQDGFAITNKPVITKQQATSFKKSFSQEELYRRTIDMARYNMGKGVYKYFAYPLPSSVQELREQSYEKLVGLANEWNVRMKYKREFPESLASFQRAQKKIGQVRPTPLILRYEAGDFNSMHQDVFGDSYFPFQMIVGLTEFQKDYTGGELVLIKTRPRAQSLPYILQIPFTHAVILASSRHPQPGKKGFYQTGLKHGVAEIKSGERFTLGIIFHDYKERN